MPSDTNGERRNIIKIPVPWSSQPLELRGFSVVMGAIVIVDVLIAYTLITHTVDGKVTDRRVVRAMSEIAVSNRVFACTVRQKQEEREAEENIRKCERLAREGTRLFRRDEEKRDEP